MSSGGFRLTCLRYRHGNGFVTAVARTACPGGGWLSGLSQWRTGGGGLCAGARTHPRVINRTPFRGRRNRDIRNRGKPNSKRGARPYLNPAQKQARWASSPEFRYIPVSRDLSSITHDIRSALHLHHFLHVCVTHACPVYKCAHLPACPRAQSSGPHASSRSPAPVSHAHRGGITAITGLAARRSRRAYGHASQPLPPAPAPSALSLPPRPLPPAPTPPPTAPACRSRPPSPPDSLRPPLMLLHCDGPGRHSRPPPLADCR